MVCTAAIQTINLINYLKALAHGALAHGVLLFKQ